MRMKKRKLLHLIIIVIIFVVMLFLACKFVVPALTIRAIENKLEKKMDKEISISGYSFVISKGLDVSRLLIVNTTGEEKKIWFRVDDLSIRYRFGEVIKNLLRHGKNFPAWQLDLQVNSRGVTLGTFRLENFVLPLRLEDYRFTTDSLIADIYGGVFQSSFCVDFNSDGKDCFFQGTLSRLDFYKMGEASNPPPKKRFKGALSISLNLAGPMRVHEELKGYGQAVIEEGELWEFPLLGGLMAILKLPNLEKVVFHEGRMNFTVDEGLIATEDLELISDQLKVLARGKMDFKGNFQPAIIYKISFSKRLLEGIPLLGDLISSILDETGHLISQVEVSGSLKNPRHRLVPLVRGIEDILRVLDQPGKKKPSEETVKE